MLSNSLDICVLHVSGSENLIADALSWGNNSYTQHLVPDLVIHTFQPSCDLLGAAKKQYVMQLCPGSHSKRLGQ